VTTPDIPAEEPSAERASFPQRSGLGVTTAALTVFTGAEPGPSADPAQLESPLEIAERIQWASATNVDDMTLDLFDSMILDVIDQYERVGPSRLAPHVAQHRRQVHEIMRSPQHPRQRDRLYLIACRLSCILGALALDLGQWAQARAYAIESFHLAEMVDQADDLRAWVRATQSLIEYYACRYPDAVALARDGQRFARGGPHTIRLAVNGEARALARLGDHRGVDEAVDRALTRLADEPASPSVSSSLTVGAYCDARTAGNAATAYLSLGQPARAIEYATRALATFDAAGLRGPQALTRLDLATAVIRPPGTADPERAAALVHEALSVAQADQYQPVAQRAAEFLQSVEPWHDLPAVRDVEEAVRSRWDTARPALP